MNDKGSKSMVNKCNLCYSRMKMRGYILSPFVLLKIRNAETLRFIKNCRESTLNRMNLIKVHGIEGYCNFMWNNSFQFVLGLIMKISSIKLVRLTLVLAEVDKFVKSKGLFRVNFLSSAAFANNNIM